MSNNINSPTGAAADLTLPQTSYQATTRATAENASRFQQGSVGNGVAPSTIAHRRGISIESIPTDNRQTRAAHEAPLTSPPRTPWSPAQSSQGAQESWAGGLPGRIAAQNEAYSNALRNVGYDESQINMALTGRGEEMGPPRNIRLPELQGHQNVIDNNLRRQVEMNLRLMRDTSVPQDVRERAITRNDALLALQTRR